MRILGITGSLRQASCNTALLKAAIDLMPSGAILDIYSPAELPLYNADLDGEVKPEPVARLLGAIKKADALLFGTPEYNHSVPGGLKNLIDWASRPAFQSVMTGKPAGIISASASFVGGARGQAHLKLILDSTLSPVFPYPEVLVGMAQSKFNGQGELTDSATKTFLKAYLKKFVSWVDTQSSLNTK